MSTMRSRTRVHDHWTQWDKDHRPQPATAPPAVNTTQRGGR